MQATDQIRIHRGVPTEQAEHITTIERSALTRFSRTALDLLGSSQDIHDFGIETEGPDCAIMHVIDWVKEKGAGNTQTRLPMHDSMRISIWTLQICHAMGISNSNRGSIVKDAILQYMRTVPLTLQEFTLLAECFPKEVQLRMMAIRETEKRFRAEGSQGVPDWYAIKAYCTQNHIPVGGAIGDCTPVAGT